MRGKRAISIGFLAAMCMASTAFPLAQEPITVTSVPGNPWSYNSDLIFKQGAKEIARQHTDDWGNIAPVSGAVPDGLAKGYFPDGKVMMEIPFEHNRAEGVAHSFYPDGVLEGDSTYRHGILNGTRTGYYRNGKIKTQGDWRDGEPIGLFKLFDEQGRLEMTTAINENSSTETRFYPDGRKKSAWTRHDGKVLEASEFGEDGALRVHATKFAKLSECSVKSDKPAYTAGDAVGFSLVCHCEAAEGCFSPNVDTRGAVVRSSWTTKLVIERNGTEYLPVFCPMSATGRFDLDSKWLFKDDQQIAHVLYASQEPANGCGTRWIDRAAYSACSNHIDCIERVFARGAALLPPGNYTAWLDAGSEPAKTAFKVKSENRKQRRH